MRNFWAIMATAKTLNEAESEAVEKVCNTFGVSKDVVETEIITKPTLLFKAKVLASVKLEEQERLRALDAQRELEEKREQEKREEERLALQHAEEVARREREEAERKEAERNNWQIIDNYYKTSVAEIVEVFPSFVMGAVRHLFEAEKLLNDTNDTYNLESMLNDIGAAFLVMSQKSSPDNPCPKDAIDMLFNEVAKRHWNLNDYFTRLGYDLSSEDIELVMEEKRERVYELLGTRSYMYSFVELGESDLLHYGKDFLYEYASDEEYANRDSAEGMVNLNIDIFLGYFQFLLLIPLLINDYGMAKRILANQELTNIIYNSNNKAIEINGGEERYAIYERYYSDALSDDKLSLDNFRNASNVAIYFDLFGNENGTDDYLAKLGVEPEKIIQEGIDKLGEGDFFFLHYLSENYIEKGKLNCLLGEDGHKLNERSFCYSMMKWMTKYVPWNRFFVEVTLTESFMHDNDLYFKKYKLLNPEYNDKSKTIRAAFENLVTGVDFENALKLLYEEKGYIVETTKTTGDQGADLIINKGGYRAVIQAKYYSTPVGNSAVQEVIGALRFYDAQKGIVITNNTFTNAAIELANANDVDLIDGDALDKMLSEVLL